MREAIIEAAELEKGDGSVSDGDWAYNQAIGHVIEAARALPLPPSSRKEAEEWHAQCVKRDEALRLAREAIETHLTWIERERQGPLYPAHMSRDDPGGEQIWRVWWDDQLRLCALTEDQSRSALAAIDAAIDLALKGEG